MELYSTKEIIQKLFSRAPNGLLNRPIMRSIVCTRQQVIEMCFTSNKSNLLLTYLSLNISVLVP